MRWLIGLVLCLSLLPQAVSASVRINEVAWMGTKESYLCNWIELYNQSDSPVTVTDWTLEIDDTVRALQDGEGDAATIPGGGFLLLERVTNTCANPVPAVDGWYLTLGNLPNSGATLTLRRPGGTIADRVVGGEEWSTIGGDNETKETAQRTSGGWITATPTPGESNQSAVAETSTDVDAEEQEGSVSTTAASELVFSTNDGNQATILEEGSSNLALTINGPATTYVGQPITLTVAPSGTGAGVANSLHYQWNFGDRHSTTKQEPSHSYRFPGKYVVTVRGTYSDFSATARHEVTVLPVRLSIGRDARQNIQVHNDAPYEIDLSQYTVTGKRSVTFPARTILLPGQTITIEQHTVEDDVAGFVTVRNAREEVVADNLAMVQSQYGSTPATNSNPVPTVAGASRTDSNRSASMSFVSSPTAATSATTTTSTTTTAWSPKTPQPAAPAQVTMSWVDYWPYAALGGLILLTAAFLFLPAQRRQPADTTADWFA